MNILRKGIRYTAKVFIRGLMRVDTSEVILKLIKDNNYKTYAEVGVWKGKTLFEIAKVDKNLLIWGIDSYSCESYKGNKQRDIMARTHNISFKRIEKEVGMKALLFKNVTLMLQKSTLAASSFKDKSLDIVFIDANHDYKNVCLDIKAWLPKVREGGILCGHNFSLMHFGVIKAVADTIGCNLEVKPDVCLWILRIDSAYKEAKAQPSLTGTYE